MGGVIEKSPFATMSRDMSVILLCMFLKLICYHVAKEVEIDYYRLIIM